MMPRANHNPTYHPTTIKSPVDDIFEFDDSDAWRSGYQLSTVVVPSKKLQTSVRNFNAGSVDNRAPMAPSSLPVNIPEWSKILKNRAENGRSKERDVMSDDEEESSCVDAEHRIPPHEYLAMRRGTSFSVHEGIGRTLKGRDLRQVRNAVWKRVGFED